MNAQAAYFQNNPEDPAVVLAADNNYAFNEFLQFTAEQGVIGLWLLILLGVLIVRTNDRTNSVWLIISKAGILSVVVFGLFSYPAQILPIKLNLVLFLAIVASFGNPVHVSLFSIPENIRPWLKRAVLVLVFAGAAAGTLHLNELRKAVKTWKLGLDIYNSGNVTQAVMAYELVAPFFNRNGDFLMNYGKALSMAGEHKKAIRILHEAENHLNNTIIQTALGDSYAALGRFEEAESAYLLASRMLPDRFYPQYLLAVFYEETGQIERAVPIARELLDKEPRIESTAVNEIKQEMARILYEYERQANHELTDI
jgi:O-antigen polymerase